ncbi:MULTISPECIES: ATP-binding protein [unclassified Streptomyces]|uniref:sensor histidine kinase n=1 Tax=unclassified Streptomyces TaxID=2593676 RepID=UPI00336A5A6C
MPIRSLSPGIDPPAAARLPGSGGPWAREYVAFNRRLALYGRAGVMSACAVLGVVAMPVDEMAPTAVVAAAVLAWSWIHLRLATTPAMPPRSLLTLDLAVMTALCLSQRFTIPETQTTHGGTWVMVCVNFTAVAYQLMQPLRTAMLATLWLCCADVVGAALHPHLQWPGVLRSVIWVVVNTVLARAVVRLVFSESRAADDAADRAARARRHGEAAEARCAAEREHLAALHDTACATLLIASAPWASMRTETLRAQAARDLVRLRAEQPVAGEVDLAAELLDEIVAHPLRVISRFDEDLGTAWRPVAAALRGGLGEALRNVARYAGVEVVRVTAHRAGEVIVVTIADHGVGFDPERIPTQRIGIKRSIRGRMWNVGGRATVESRPGHGTTVRLEWPRG